MGIVAFKLRTTPGTIIRGSVILFSIAVGGDAQDTGKSLFKGFETECRPCHVRMTKYSNSPSSNWSKAVLLILLIDSMSFFELL